VRRYAQTGRGNGVGSAGGAIAVGPSDHQLFLTVSNNWHEDLLHCVETRRVVYNDAGVGDSVGFQYDKTVAGTSTSKATTLAVGAVRVYIEEVELHIAYVKPTENEDKNGHSVTGDFSSIAKATGW
jgi:hypothetical protein